MRERAATYDGSWSSLQKPKPVKTKTGLTTLDGHVFGTVTKGEYDRLRAEDPIQFVAYQGGTHGGSEAA